MKFLFAIFLFVQLNYSMENSSLCVVCQENIDDSDNMRKTLCDHQFHKDCINDWVHRNPTCPLCKKHVTSHRELIEAAKDDKTDKCIKLLIEGVDIDGGDEYGYNALHHAVYLHHYETVNFLLGNGAKVDSLDKNEDTPLIHAAAQGDERILKILLQNGAAVDHVDKDKWTALMTAAWYHKDGIVKILLKYGANSNLKNRDGHTAREIAANCDRVQKVFKDFEEEKQNTVNRLFLEEAAEGDVCMVQDLLANGANINSFDLNGVTALHYAAMKGNEILAKALLEHNPDVDCRSKVGEYTALMYATGGGFGKYKEFMYAVGGCKPNSNIVKLLLDKGASKDLKNSNEKTAFDMATDPECKRLLENNATDWKCTCRDYENINYCNCRYPCSLRLRNAEKPDYLADWKEEVITYLLKKPQGTDLSNLGTRSNHIKTTIPIDQLKKSGFNKLQDALQSMSEVVVFRDGINKHPKARLLKHFYEKKYQIQRQAVKDADITMEKILRKTEIQGVRAVKHNVSADRLFLAAAKAGDVSTVQDLIAKGADIDIMDCDGFKALHYATMAKNEALVETLLEHNAAVNCRKNGNVRHLHHYDTPLMFAARYGYAVIMNMLLDKGANQNLKNSDGQTALDLANDDNCKKLLENNPNFQLDLANDDNCKKLLGSTAQTRNLNKMFLTAAEEGDVSRVQYLIAKGAEIDVCGATALLHATLLGNEMLVKALLEHNPNVNCSTHKFAYTPLHHAARLGYAAIMKMLLDKGANPILKNYYGQTPLDLTENENCKSMLKNHFSMKEGSESQNVLAPNSSGYKFM